MGGCPNDPAKVMDNLKYMIETLNKTFSCPPTCPAKCQEAPPVMAPPQPVCCCHLKGSGGKLPDLPVKRVKSFELRSSFLYKGCDCEKRYGLQDDCQRTDCRGSPQCLTNPPTCPPSEYCGGKHLAKKFKRNLRKVKKFALI